MVGKNAHDSKDLTVTNINLVEACIIGVVAAIGAVLLKEGVGAFGAMRLAIEQNELYFFNYKIFQSSFSANLSYAIFGLFGGLISGALIQFVAPQANGSGIPQVKASILGIPQDLSLRTAAVKLVSCVVALGSGLSMGREGPTVQLSAALSANASKLIHSSPKHRAQLIAAGAGAGLAAAFNAPLAGVLFVLEELLGRMSGFAVGTTVVACFVAAVLSRLVGVHSLDIHMSKLNSVSTFAALDIPFYLLLGAVSGLLGALFNKGIIAGLTLNRDLLKWPVTITCGLAGLITALLVTSLPPLFHDYTGLREALLSGKLDLNTILLALALQFVLTVLAYSSGAPGGLFAPSLTIGACLGLLAAMVEQHFCGTANAITFAIVGMGAVFCAVARVPMTAVVIIFEMTTDFNVVLPLMISCVVSYLVAEKLDPGSIYDQLLEWVGIDTHVAEGDAGIMISKTASDVMQKAVETIDQKCSLAEVRALFSASKHHGFPVVDENRRPIGIITHHDMLDFDRLKHDQAAAVVDLMIPNPVTIDSDESLAEVVLALEKYKISRLPVVENGRLIGIITRDDIVAAESQSLHRAKSQSGSYIIYQTRSAAQGKGRLLMLIGTEVNTCLLSLAASLAKSNSYELELLHVIVGEKNSEKGSLTLSHKGASRARQAAQSAEAFAEPYGIPIHTSVRLAQRKSIALSDTARRREVDVLILDLAQIVGAEKIELQEIATQFFCPLILASSFEQTIDSKSKFKILNLSPGSSGGDTSSTKSVRELFSAFAQFTVIQSDHEPGDALYSANISSRVKSEREKMANNEILILLIDKTDLKDFLSRHFFDSILLGKDSTLLFVA